MSASEVGPIWRSIRRHRAFALLLIEVALGFFIIGNLLMTIRWYDEKTLPPPGYNQEDLVEVVSRRPARDDDADGTRVAALRARERAELAALPGVRGVAAVSSTHIDDRWGMPTLFWTEAGQAAGASLCEGVSRDDGVVAGWDVAAEPALAQVLDLRLAGGTFFGPGGAAAPDTVVITRCLAGALFGRTPALGRVLLSNRRPPARIVGVIEDVRMHVAFLYQAHVTAIYPVPPDDPRIARWVVRAAPGRAEAVRAAAGPALGALELGERLVTARLSAADQTYSAGVARGTAIVLIAVAMMLGVLAVLGNFSVASFLVSDRRRVIGVRRALGATRWDIFRYLVIENLLPTQLGNLAGLAIVLATLPAAKARFTGIHFAPVDALAAAFLLSLGGVLAKLLPALRATRIPPSEVTKSL